MNPAHRVGIEMNKEESAAVVPRLRRLTQHSPKPRHVKRFVAVGRTEATLRKRISRGASALLLSLWILAVLPASADAGADWIDRVAGPGGGDDKATAVTCGIDGSVYVTAAISTAGSGKDIHTTKYDSDGLVVWNAVYDGPGSGDDVPASVAVGGDGFVHVTGYSDGAGTDLDFATIKYSPDGSELWVARLNGPESGRDLPYEVEVDDNGNVYVTGSIWAGDIWWDYMTVKYDPGGTELWRGRYDGPWSTCDQALALEVDPQGNVYVTGCSEDSLTSWDYGTIKYSSEGEELWVARYTQDYFAADCATGIALGAQGEIYVTGQSRNDDGDSDLVTVAYGPDGGELWVARFDEAGLEDSGTALAVGPSGSVFVAGSSEDDDGVSDYLILRYDPNGVELWASRYEGTGGQSVAEAVAVDGFGGVYVTGRSFGGDGTLDIATVKYDGGGSEMWAEVYDGEAGGVDRGLAMAVDGQGAVYVSGESEGVPGDLDALTIKYSVETGAGCDGICETVPAPLSLAPPTPNPFRGRTTLGFTLPAGEQSGRITVYDVKGRVVSRMGVRADAEGLSQAIWDGANASGRRAAAGVYFIALDAGGETASRKVVLMK